MGILGPSFTQATETSRLEVQFEQTVDQSFEELAFKGSLAFKEKLTTYLEEYVAQSVPEKDFVAWENGTLPVTTMQEWMERDFITSPPMKRRERMQARIKRWIEIEVKRFEDAKEQRELKSEALKRLRAFMGYWPKPDLAKLFISFLKEEKLSVSPFIKKKTLLYEDIAPMLYIHQMLYGIEREDRFDHIVIDEAQDSSPFMISVLKERTRPGGFTILGDLAQGIHGSEGISSWSSFQEVFADKGISYVKMERSYRSTMEIIEFSNRILSQMKHSPGQAIPVFRSGQEVLVEQRGKDDICKWVKQMEQKQAQTIAVLTRTKEESADVYAHLQSQGVTATLLQASDRTYRGGTSVMPIYLAKGFEFDAVLLTDVSQVLFR
ncbi:3'-5' exonuclease [Bacillus sp. JCM 19041]|uniref:3'-5' exonuclease n=1 Tax=Bacillus sp. JCM 19041 TaxID=1460637 RepID=UPI0006CF9DC1